MRNRGFVLWLFLGLLLAPAAAAGQPCCGPVTADGARLAALLDASGVDHRWLARQHIIWETGAPDPARPGVAPGHDTHCSAYAAAMAERVGLYLLRPPQHSQHLLANAQSAWLESDAGRAAGWRTLDGAQAAQTAANRGEFVVAVYANPDPEHSGHIAVLRPSEKSLEDLTRDGPQEAQAGATNALSTTVADGFRHHPGAWVPDGQPAVRFFAHAVDWGRAG